MQERNKDISFANPNNNLTRVLPWGWTCVFFLMKFNKFSTQVQNEQSLFPIAQVCSDKNSLSDSLVEQVAQCQLDDVTTNFKCFRNVGVVSCNEVSQTLTCRATQVRTCWPWPVQGCDLKADETPDNHTVQDVLWQNLKDDGWCFPSCDSCICLQEQFSQEPHASLDVTIAQAYQHENHQRTNGFCLWGKEESTKQCLNFLSLPFWNFDSKALKMFLIFLSVHQNSKCCSQVGIPICKKQQFLAKMYFVFDLFSLLKPLLCIWCQPEPRHPLHNTQFYLLNKISLPLQISCRESADREKLFASSQTVRDKKKTNTNQMYNSCKGQMVSWCIHWIQGSRRNALSSLPSEMKETQTIIFSMQWAWKFILEF